MKNQLILTLVSIGITAGASIARAQHGHLNAGANGVNQDDPLIWRNGADFVAESGYVKTLDFADTDRFTGFFQGGITLTSLPATAANAGPHPDAPAPGAFIQFRFSVLDAPPGGEFGFWEAGATSPTISLAAGETSPELFPVSESDGSAGSDPFGHIHGRRFTATSPGLYKVGFTAVDTSTNGADGGPIHTASEELPVWFQAGVNIQSLEPDFEDGNVHVRFGARDGFQWQVEYSTTLDPSAEWLPVGDPVTGNDTFVEILHDSPPAGERFYRVAGTPFVP